MTASQNQRGARNGSSQTGSAESVGYRPWTVPDTRKSLGEQMFNRSERLRRYSRIRICAVLLAAKYVSHTCVAHRISPLAHLRHLHLSRQRR